MRGREGEGGSIHYANSELGSFKNEIKEEVQQVKTRVAKMEDGLKMTNIRMKDMENKIGNLETQGNSGNPSHVKKIEELAKLVQEIQLLS